MLSAHSVSLQSGNNLLHYQLVEPIGQGGMGVVWRAHDSTLGRDVAIKVLPDVFAADPERVARFEREARVLASLNHPQIGSIYGFHAAGSVRFLALELVEGEDLEQRLARGPLSSADTVAIARQLAEALEYAHEHGVVHRDFKPANVKLTPDGRVKVLDFGLAKALDFESAPTSSVWDPGHSPTLTVALTHAQVILGTAAYMSPEQARGRAVDKRADVWAFGVVVYEMLTGERLFDGETASDTLASVLKTDIDWTKLPKQTPTRLVALLRRCLERDPQKRLRDIGEARIALDSIAAGTEDSVSRTAGASRSGLLRWAPAAIGVAGVIAGALAAMAFVPRGPRVERNGLPRRFFAVPTFDVNREPTSPAVSPDGRAIAYVIQGELWVRRLDEFEPRKIADAENPVAVTWSPDNASVAYVSGTKIFRVEVNGGQPQAVADARGGFTGGTGLTWTGANTLVASRGEIDGLLEVSDRGGDLATILAPDTTKETDFHEPSALPGGKGLLFAVHTQEGTNQIDVLANGKRKILLKVPNHTVAGPRYSPTGHVLFWRSAPTPGIWAFPFSIARAERTGEPFLVVSGAAQHSLADDGTLVYRTAIEGGNLQLVWMDREGKEIEAISEPASGFTPEVHIAADGRTIYTSQEVSGNTDVWSFDAVRRTRTRLTFDEAREVDAVPVPGSDRMVYQVGTVNFMARLWRIVVRPIGGGSADTLDFGFNPRVSPDGRWVTYTNAHSDPAGDLRARSLAGDSTVVTIAADNATQVGGVVSPSGNLVAYFSNESGRHEVYLRTFPSGTGKWQVSQDGGTWPRWNGRGDRLFFVKDDDMMEVDVAGGPNPTLGVPRKLFTRPPAGRWFNNLPNSYDVTADGQRFAIFRRPGANVRGRSIALVQDWMAEFREKKPAR